MKILKLNDGIYTASDVATILHLPIGKVRRWLNDYWNKKLAKKGESYSYGEYKNTAINFYHLIEFYTFYQLRLKGVTIKEITDAHLELQKVFNTNYPFAQNNLSTDGKKVWYDYLENIICANGKFQGAFKPIIEPFLNKIEFDKDNFAKKFYPLGKEKDVIVDPKIQLGQPILDGTRIPASTILHLLRGGEKPLSIASLYDIDIQAVKDVQLFYKIAS